jgi:hypothetical protein
MLRPRSTPKSSNFSRRLSPASPASRCWFRCTAPDFLDTERDAAVIIRALASGEKAAFWGNTQIAPPCLKSPL